MIQPERIHGSSDLADRKTGEYVIYWMQDAVRTEYNHALEYAIDAANQLKRPLLVIFVLTEHFPEATLRHYQFLIEGLIDVDHLLTERGIRLQVLVGDPKILVPSMAEDACLLVTDHGYLRIQTHWRDVVRDNVSCPMVMVETGVIVPVAIVSPKMDWSAGTFRPKITRQLPRYLVELRPRTLHSSSLGWDTGDYTLSNSDSLLSRLNIDTSVFPVSIQGGQSSAKAQLSWFLENRLYRYGEARNDPTARATSRISPYLHFGQISPLYIALAVRSVQDPAIAPFLEQLIVRRELAINFVQYNPGYDQYESAVPDWSKRTLTTHMSDARQYLYTPEELTNGDTHDPYWNAMQTELSVTGYLHGYFRMYWGKKILEWSETPDQAYATALSLNNRYFLDGRDPNGFTGVAWCFGRHDRPWKERTIFGTVRFMNDTGLKRKFRMDTYLEKVKTV